MLVTNIDFLEHFLLVTMFTEFLVFALLLSIANAAESCEGRLDVREECVELLAREMRSLATSVDEILQTVQKGMLSQREMSLAGHARAEDKSRREKEERSDDGLNANNGDPLLPMMNDTNLEERVALLEFQMANV